jgi:serine/threonine protein phosphatase PrpC
VRHARLAQGAAPPDTISCMCANCAPLHRSKCNFISHPSCVHKIQSCTPCLNGSSQVVEHALQTMEDAHIAQTTVNGNDDMSLFAVFDGHGGPEVAKFCAKYMVPELVKLANFNKGDLDSALKDAFHHIDDMLMDDQYASEVAAVRSAQLMTS